VFELMKGSDIVISSICYCGVSQVISYTFRVNGFERELTGKMSGDLDIRGIEFSDSLDELMMFLMPFDTSVSKRLLSISWACVDGEVVDFPFVLVRF